MAKLLVVVTSGGKNWVGPAPEQDGKMHGVRIIQIPVDAEEIIAKDPAGELPPLDGRHAKIAHAILKPQEVQDWLKAKKHEISERIENLWIGDGLKEDTIVHVAVRCKGGYQRSVAFAENIVLGLQCSLIGLELSIHFPQHTFVLQHLTLETAQIAKAWLARDGYSLDPFLRPLTRVC